MSRRSRIATVVRVAEIRETAARAQVAAATRDRDLAQRALSQRQAELAQTSLSGGTAVDLLRSVQIQGLRADATVAAAVTADTAQTTRDTSVRAWADLANRARLLRDLETRQKAAQVAAADAATQKLLDDLAASRAAGSTRATSTPGEAS